MQTIQIPRPALIRGQMLLRMDVIQTGLIASAQKRTEFLSSFDFMFSL